MDQQDKVSPVRETSSVCKNPRCKFHLLRPVSWLENSGVWPSHAIRNTVA